MEKVKFEDIKTPTTVEGETGFSKNCKNPTWYGIDNQILRDFYVKTLGDFSGYVRSQEV